MARSMAASRPGLPLERLSLTVQHFAGRQLVDLENGFRVALDIRRQHDVAAHLAANLGRVIGQPALVRGGALLGLGGGGIGHLLGARIVLRPQLAGFAGQFLAEIELRLRLGFRLCRLGLLRFWLGFRLFRFRFRRLWLGFRFLRLGLLLFFLDRDIRLFGGGGSGFGSTLGTGFGSGFDLGFGRRRWRRRDIGRRRRRPTTVRLPSRRARCASTARRKRARPRADMHQDGERQRVFLAGLFAFFVDHRGSFAVGCTRRPTFDLGALADHPSSTSARLRT